MTCLYVLLYVHSQSFNSGDSQTCPSVLQERGILYRLTVRKPSKMEAKGNGGEGRGDRFLMILMGIIPEILGIKP